MTAFTESSVFIQFYVIRHIDHPGWAWSEIKQKWVEDFSFDMFTALEKETVELPEKGKWSEL